MGKKKNLFFPNVVVGKSIKTNLFILETMLEKLKLMSGPGRFLYGTKRHWCLICTCNHVNGRCCSYYFVSELCDAFSIAFITPSTRKIKTFKQRDNEAKPTVPTLFLHGLCCIGPHVIAASISLVYDIKSWYDTIAAIPIVLLVCIGFRKKVFFRGILHVTCLLVGIISQEVSRQPRSIDWNQLPNPEFLAFYLCITHLLKGLGTFVKLLPSAAVINSPDKYMANWKDFVGLSMSILSSVYFLQEPNIYRNHKGMARWRWTFAQVETLHWAGLALSASTNFEAFGWSLVLFNSLQSLLGYSFFYSYSDGG